MLARLDHHRDDLGQSAVDLLLAGVSTRRVGELLERIIRLPVSAVQVSRLAKRLAAAVRQFHTRSLADEYVYLLLDAIYLKARGAPRLIETGLRRTRKRVVLVAYGVTRAGIKQIIDFRVAKRTSAPAWRNFLWSLHRRGLKGQSLKLVTSAGCGGLSAAVQAVYPFVPRQRCWFHKMQSVAGKLRRKDQTRVLRGLRPVYQAPHRRTAERAALAWAELWRERYPAAVACIAQDLNALPAFYDVPAAQRRMVRTTNPSARRFREVRRQTDSIGTSVNDARRERIVYGLPAYYNGKHAACVCKEFRKVRCGA